jgi:hypothetical protein
MSYFTERKKAQRTLGFLTNSGLELCTYFYDEFKDTQQH